MNYIVFDLEWNQNPKPGAKPNTMLPFEIIEIGAVKLDGDRQVVDTFHRLIKPSVYHWIQDSVHQVIHMDYKDLKHGDPFDEAVEAFMSWCGEDYRFCTWAKQDVAELQRNMRYYYMLDLLPGPVIYEDVQKLYSLSFEDGKIRRSLEFVIDQLALEKSACFHRALADAMYTAMIFQRIDESYLTGYESVDVYQNPKEAGEELMFVGKNREKFISREFTSRERAVHNRHVQHVHCPVCEEKEKLPNQTGWFSTSAKVYFCVSACPIHGPVVGRIRIRRTDEDRFFAVKTLRLAEQAEAEEIRAKKNKKSGSSGVV